MAVNTASLKEWLCQLINYRNNNNESPYDAQNDSVYLINNSNNNDDEY